AFAGRKPSNTKRSLGRPATLSAAMKAQGPGTGLTFTPAARAARTRRKPGSLTSGVPASDTRASESPASSRATRRSAWASSLCSCSGTSGRSIPAWARSWRVWRVSSAQMAATSASTWRARGDRSPRLPIGVATTCSVPGARAPSAGPPLSTSTAIRPPRRPLARMVRIVTGSRKSAGAMRTRTLLPPVLVRGVLVLGVLVLGLAACSTTVVRHPAPVAVGEAPPPAATDIAREQFRFEQRPPAAADGYRPPLKLAVLLPLAGDLARAAVPVRDGVLAGYYAESRQRPEIRFYDTATGALQAYDRAVADGADFVLGPLGREEVGALFRRGALQVPVLALNRANIPPPPGSASFSLAPEDDGIAAAGFLLERNARRVLVLADSDDSMQRAATAFRDSFTQQG